MIHTLPEWATILAATLPGALVGYTLARWRARCPYRCVSCGLRASLDRLGLGR